MVDLLFNWLFAFRIDTFETFLFIEAKNFESLEGDYYKVINKPLSYEEISGFYYNKMHNLSKALAVIMGHSVEVGSAIIARF
jgi:hypothetical protein